MARAAPLHVSFLEVHPLVHLQVHLTAAPLPPSLLYSPALRMESRPILVANDGLIDGLAAIACGIALSKFPDRTKDVPDAVELAVRYVEAGIRTSFGLGHGNGPINHFHSLSMRLPPPCPSTVKRSLYGKAKGGGAAVKGS